MTQQIFIDGKFVPRDQAKVSVFDHCLLYGDGIFEGIRLYEGCVFRLTEHLERLYSSARYIMLDIPLSLEEMRWVVVESCRRNNLTDGYIRLVVTRGVGDLGLSPWLCKTPSVICIAASIALYPEEAYRDGLAVITAPTQRTSASALNPRIKSCNYLNNIMAKIEARNAGVVEALMLNADGFVVECTGDNLFLINGNTITTPPTYMGALRGITRDAIIEIAREMGYEVRQEPFTRFEVFDADEVFMTGTAAEVVPVVKVDGRPIGNGRPGATTHRLNEQFRKRVSGEGTRLDSELPEPQRLGEIW